MSESRSGAENVADKSEHLVIPESKENYGGCVYGAQNTTSAGSHQPQMNPTGIRKEERLRNC